MKTDCISGDLRLKLKKFDDSIKNKILLRKVSDYFTWDEFCEIFIKIPSIFNFTYKTIDIEMSNIGKERAEFNLHTDQGHEYHIYPSALILLQKAIIEDKKLKEVYRELSLI